MKYLASCDRETLGFRGNALPKRSLGRMLLVLCMAIVATAALLLVASAAPSTTGSAITNGVKGGAQQLFNLMEAVVIPIGAICFAWNAFKVFFGGERGMEQAKKNILLIVVVLALVFLAPPIVKEVGGWFGSGHWGELG